MRIKGGKPEIQSEPSGFMWKPPTFLPVVELGSHCTLLIVMKTLS